MFQPDHRFGWVAETSDRVDEVEEHIGVTGQIESTVAAWIEAQARLGPGAPRGEDLSATRRLILKLHKICETLRADVRPSVAGGRVRRF
jgi:hypothetical protein